MATFDSVKTITGIAGTAISIYRFVVIAADGQYDHVGTAQIRADGVSAEAQATVGQPFGIVKQDGAIAKVESGAAITAGAQVATDNAGKVITHVTTAGNYILGVAKTASSADGEIIEVILTAAHQDGA
tara:strand:- start:442 stop:825 length:384 start_codon:yes stop_codon:yes gene_type:complete